MTFSFVSTCINTFSFSIFGEGSVSVDLLHRFSSSIRSCWSSSREGFSFVCSNLQQYCHSLHPILDNIIEFRRFIEPTFVVASVYLAKATYTWKCSRICTIMFCLRPIILLTMARDYTISNSWLFAFSWFRMLKYFQKHLLANWQLLTFCLLIFCSSNFFAEISCILFLPHYLYCCPTPVPCHVGDTAICFGIW